MPDSSGQQGAVEGRLIRGGTSRGYFIREDALPVDLEDELVDPLALELFGSPDPIQVDGIGGSHSHTSKLMVVSPSDREGVDIDYTFGQVAIERPVVDWGGNCGNLTSAIGAFGILEGLVEPTVPETTVTLYNTNTDTVVDQTIPVMNGAPAVYGEYKVDGIAGTGARIDSVFHDPAGGVLGSLLPTGNLVDEIAVDGERIDVSLVDVANPCVFVRASDMGLEGDELPVEMASTPGLLDRFERIRSEVCEQIGLVDDAADAPDETPTTPFIATVAPPLNYDCSVDRSIAASEIDTTGRIITTGTPHHAYAMTGAMSLAAASQLPGTIPSEVVRSPLLGERVTIGHPKGTIDVGVDADLDGETPTVESVTVSRTVRPLFTGEVYYRYVDELERLR